MDFLNEIIVKSENEHPNFEFDVAADHSTDDWCIKDEYSQVKDAFDQEPHSNSYDISLQRCFRCNEVLFYDSHSLLQHNLMHLQVTLEKLPDQIFEFYEQPAKPTEGNETQSDSVICSNVKVESESYFDTCIVKCEVEEICENSTDVFIDTENSRKDQGNLDLENFDKNKNYEFEEINSVNIMDQFLKNQFTVIKNSNRVIKYEEIEDSQSDSTDQFTNVDNPRKESKCEIKSNSLDRFKGLENPKEVIKKVNNNLLKKTQKQCHICLKILSRKQCGQHISEVHLNKKVKCNICHKEFKCKKNMKTHMKYLHGNMTFQCDHCKTVYTSKDSMQKHMKNVHGKAVHCQICNSRLASEVYLESHMKRVHYDDGKVHSCDICGKIFKSPRYVRVHMKNSHSVNSKKRMK